MSEKTARAARKKASDDQEKQIVLHEPFVWTDPRSNLSLEIPANVPFDKIGVSLTDLETFADTAFDRGVESANRFLTARAWLSDAGTRIAACAFCNNGTETRAAMREATHLLAKAISEFKSEMKALESDRLLRPNVEAIENLMRLSLDIHRHAEAYFIIEPGSPKDDPDYQKKMRASNEALQELRLFLKSIDGRLEKLLERLGSLRDPRGRKPDQCKAFIGKLARGYPEQPPGGMWKIGQNIFRDLRSIPRAMRSTEQADAFEFFREQGWFFDPERSTEVADKRSLGVFISEAIKLKNES